ncbi:MAG: SCO family protein, partial [Acidimicrobiales bacterium]|nr:SCO family protein [Acidimicrobiales bacterium]
MARRSSGSMRWLPLGTAAFLLIVAIVVRTAASNGSPAADWSGTLIDPPRQRPVFALQTIDGEPFDFAARTRDRLTFLFFGYTNCPDVCPTQMSALTGALRERPDLAGDVVFVTTDPIRDTPDRIRSWLSSFGYPVTCLLYTS